MIKYFCDRCGEEIEEWDLSGLFPNKGHLGVRFWMGVLKSGVRQDDLKEYLVLHRECMREYARLLDTVKVYKC